MKLMLITSIAIVLVGCPNPPNPPPNDADAAPAPYDARNDDASLGARRCCANLVMLGCTKEAAGQCATRIDLMTKDVLRVPPFEVDCCAGAATKEMVRTCPGIKCE